MDYGDTLVCRVESISVTQMPVCGFCWQTLPFVSRAPDENDALDPEGGVRKERKRKMVEGRGGREREGGRRREREREGGRGEKREQLKLEVLW